MVFAFKGNSFDELQQFGRLSSSMNVACKYKATQ